MYHICRTERAEAREHLIAETFLRLLQKQEFHTVQITALCEAAGIPRKAFYRFFDTKEDIISFYTEDTLLSLIGQLNPDPGTREVCVQNCAIFFRFWMEHPDEMAVIFRGDTIGHFWTAMMRFMLDQRLLNLALTPASPVQNPELAAALAASNLLHLLLYWNYNGKRETAEEMGELLFDSLTRPLLPESLWQARTAGRF